MSGYSAARAVPPGDKDDAAVLPDTEKASDLFAGRDEGAPQPGGAGEEVLPGLSLILDRIGTALDEAQMMLGDLKFARAQGNWPALESAAHRLSALSKSAAKTVSEARSIHQQATSKTE